GWRRVCWLSPPSRPPAWWWSSPPTCRETGGGHRRARGDARIVRRAAARRPRHRVRSLVSHRGLRRPGSGGATRPWDLDHIRLRRQPAAGRPARAGSPGRRGGGGRPGHARRPAAGGPAGGGAGRGHGRGSRRTRPGGGDVHGGHLEVRPPPGAGALVSRLRPLAGRPGRAAAVRVRAAVRERVPVWLVVPVVIGLVFLLAPVVALVQRAPWSELGHELASGPVRT